MIRILVNDGIHPDAALLLEEAGYEVVTDKVPQEQLVKELPAFDAIIVRSATKVTREVIDACPRLKVIVRGGVGMDNIDTAHASQKGIRLMNTPRASSQAVAELAMAHIFTLARMLHRSNREMPTEGSTEFKKLKENYSKGFELQGKSLGIIGFGRIGQSLAKIAIGAGMNILPVDLMRSETKIEIPIYNLDGASLNLTLKTVSMDEMLAEADFISIHVPFEGGKSILGAEQFAKMKKGVHLINTSRGGAINEEELLEALNSGKVAGAGLDVFDNEPKPMAALLTHPNISLSPHIGGSTQEAQNKIGMEIADGLIEFFGTNG